MQCGDPELTAKPYEIRKIDGRDHKLCRGPCHPEPTWIDTRWYRKRSDGTGMLRGTCNMCEHMYRYGVPAERSGSVPLKELYFAITELERRLGRMEAARRVGVGRTTWFKWVQRERKTIQANKAILLLTTLAEVRAHGEVRSKRDIRYGTKKRGGIERGPNGYRDYYHPTGDKDLEQRAESYRRDPEHESAKQAEYYQNRKRRQIPHRPPEGPA